MRCGTLVRTVVYILAWTSSSADDIPIKKTCESAAVAESPTTFVSALPGVQAQCLMQRRAIHAQKKLPYMREPDTVAGTDDSPPSLTELLEVDAPDDSAAAPANRKEFYFRPVSMTMYCVMWLAVQSLLIHTALAISRNVDELSGKCDNEPSQTTEILVTANRGSPYAPVMCSLFLGHRMYVLASTEGQGDPSNFAKICMLVATAGLTLQLLIVLLLPSVINKVPFLRFSDLTGDDCDAHPKLSNLKFKLPSLGYITSFLQTVSMFCIYGGVIGIAYAAFHFGRLHEHEISPAVGAAILLNILYFAVGLCLWYVRARDFSWGYLHDLKSQRYRSLMAAALSANMAVRTTPMLSIFFLTARMRALTVNPPDGTPTALVGHCFPVAVACLYAQTLASAYVGYTGKEAVGYYRAHIYSASWSAHFFQHLFGFAGLGAAGVVASQVFIGKETLSPTMNAIMALSFMYFFIHGLSLITAFARDCLRWNPVTLQNTILASGVGVSCCPMLCVLFLGCRMRALQISEQKGSPQWWEQDCLHLAVMATGIQLFCCLALPIFTGAATAVDGDGHAKFDLRPMIGAYAVTVIKYIALFSLYGAVIGVCASIMVMTPASTQAERPDDFEGWRETIRAMKWLSVVVLLAVVLSSAKVVGLAIKFGIESVDRMFLGVDITVGNAALSLCEGYVNVWDVTIMNPDDRTWQSDSLARIDRMVVKINMWKLFRSFGKNFEITALEIEGVLVNYEKHASGVTNVTWITDFMAGKQPGSPAAAVVPTPPDKPSAASSAAPAANTAEPAKAEEPTSSKSGPEVVVHRLLIEDIAAEVILPNAGTVARVDLGNLEFEDFAQHYAGKRGVLVSDTVQLVLGTLLKTLLSNTDIMRQLAGKAVTAAASNVLGFLTGGRLGAGSG